jgi:hypothetical protein
MRVYFVGEIPNNPRRGRRAPAAGDNPARNSKLGSGPNACESL